MTEVTIVADEVLSVQTTLLRRDTRSKMEMVFRVCVGTPDCEGKEVDGPGMSVQVEREAKVVYGKSVGGEAAMKESLRGKGQWEWDGAVKVLEGMLGGRAKGVKGR